MKTAARTSIPPQRTPAQERVGGPAATLPQEHQHGHEKRRTILALASVVAALAAAIVLVTLVVTGGDGGVTPAPQNQVVAPGPAVNGSDQHLLNQAEEHAHRPPAADVLPRRAPAWRAVH